MDDGEIWRTFSAALFADFREEDQFHSKKPLLAHYTSLDVLENILKSNEIWFSNPLFMNDSEEVKFGIMNGARVFKNSKAISDALASVSVVE
ncbi:MAG: hypothetical protein EXQ88_03500 [Alphaproteobacteria bacterium]|nr:hypothetical protein [Alphaproteobacteria bacterium]